MNLNWIMLIIGGFFETGFAVSLEKVQHATGWERWLWIGSFLISVSASMYLLYRSMGGSDPIPVGTAYAVWGAIGATGAVVAGILLFDEPASFWRLFFLTTLILSVVGLQVVSSR